MTTASRLQSPACSVEMASNAAASSSRSFLGWWLAACQETLGGRPASMPAPVALDPKHGLGETGGGAEIRGGHGPPDALILSQLTTVSVRHCSFFHDLSF